ncbi:MAG: type II toxin-antitoxin system HicB family antitoxin [Deltaproteobacteria bacterium]|nr:type II toxin-antitoxin system HicB family antitoxin [Deltaproteobacteria bacterium]
MEQKEKAELEVILEPNDEGGYTASVPSIPGCVSKGATIDETINNLKEGIRLYLEKVMAQVVETAKKEGLA